MLHKHFILTSRHHLCNKKTKQIFSFLRKEEIALLIFKEPGEKAEKGCELTKISVGYKICDHETYKLPRVEHRKKRIRKWAKSKKKRYQRRENEIVRNTSTIDKDRKIMGTSMKRT